MPRMGFVGGSYTARSTAVADEECINLFAETSDTAGSIAPSRSYGGQNAQSVKNYFGTPGLATFIDFGADAPVRGSWEINGRVFVVAGASLYEIFADATSVNRGAIWNDGNPASIAASAIQLLISAGGHAYCFTLAANTLVDVTSALVGTPGVVWYADGYFVLNLAGTNKYQISNPLDGTTWPGLQVNEVSVFPENIISIAVNHRDLWVFGARHIQPYQDTGSNEIYDVIPGALIEKGCVSQNCVALLDNSVFWVDQDNRGARSAWRSNGYMPQRVSTHAIEIDLQSYSTNQIAQLTSYSYQDGGHLFWVLYIPGSSWSWVYDVGEQLWHKRAYWESANGPFTPHRSWNHVSAFGMHLVGDWNSAKLYQMAMAVDNGDGTFSFVTDNGNPIRRLRRAPTVIDEMKHIPHNNLTIDIQTGIAPQPPLLDGDGNPRQPQCMLRWSDTRGKTWSNERIANLGMAGEYLARCIFYRLGRSRYRVYEWSMTDPVPVTIVDAYLNSATVIQ